MSFIEPALLWGTLAVLVPVVIHFWHQKQGRPLPWAATQWLIEKQQQQSRGFRIDNVPLLVVRCLLLLLLAFLLAQPLLNWLHQTPTIQKVHLVQPSAAIVDNYRFELTEALKQGEKVIWADFNPEPVTDKLIPPANAQVSNPLALQSAIQQVDAKNSELHLYMSANQALASVPAITVPARFKLHAMADSSVRANAFLVAKDNRNVYINRAGKLISSPALDPSLKFQPTPTHSGPIRTLIAYHNPRERQTVKAALAALTDVYGFDLTLDEQPKPDQTYDWVLTDQLPAKPNPQTLYVVSGTAGRSRVANVILTTELLTPQTSERVENGALPEWLGDQMLRHYSFAQQPQPLSQHDLTALFTATTKPTTEQQASLQNGLFLVFIGLLLVERWLALTKNA